MRACFVALGLHVVAALSCTAEPLHPFPRDWSSDDPDGSAGNDAGDGGDGGGEPANCESDDDCVIASRIDLCCSCPEAATVRETVLEHCLVPWFDAERVEQCSVECDSDCPEPGCPVPRSVTCRDSTCVLIFRGECVLDADCGEGRMCELSNSQTRCVERIGDCVLHLDCESNYWCAPNGNETRSCLRLEHGRCVTEGDCGQAPCLGLRDDAPGVCDWADCSERGCPRGYRCTPQGGNTVCLRECFEDWECPEGELCLPPWGGAVPECLGTDCSVPGGCEPPGSTCWDEDSDGLNECVNLGCLYDGHCPRGQWCEVEQATGLAHCVDPHDRCPDDCPPDNTCIDVDDDSWNECQPVQGECQRDEDCLGANQRCADTDGDGETECLDRGECQHAAECPEAEYCIAMNETGRGACVVPGDVHCAGKSECGDGLICLDVDEDGQSECVSDGSQG